jgi:predicted acylesterase/phospholipase RssA
MNENDDEENSDVILAEKNQESVDEEEEGEELLSSSLSSSDMTKKEEEEKKEDTVEEEEEEKEEEEETINNKFDTLVLPGGSVKGLFILGALQYCYDNFLLTDLHNYIGTSSGAMSSFLLAIGYTPVEIITKICTNQIIERMQHFDIFAMINNLGATSFSNISEYLEKLTIDKIGYLPTFHDLKHKFNKNFICVTYNLSKGAAEYLSYETHPTLPCLVALRMTSNLPLIFENYKYGNNFYIDGGIVDNFSIDVAQTIGNRVLGIHIVFENAKFSTSDNVLDYIYKLIYIPIKQQQKSKLDVVCKKKCKLISLSDKTNRSMFNFNLSSSEKLDMFSTGYRQCKSAF